MEGKENEVRKPKPCSFTGGDEGTEMKITLSIPDGIIAANVFLARVKGLELTVDHYELRELDLYDGASLELAMGTETEGGVK